MNTDLTEAQEDYAHFLPALSGFYATYVGKQRFPDPVNGPYVPDARMPNNFANGMESLNYLNAKLVKEFGKAIGKILIVLRHKRNVTECYVGWMHTWTME